MTPPVEDSTGEAPPSSPPSASSPSAAAAAAALKAHVASLDRIVHTFSDAAGCTRRGRMDLWNNSNRNNNNNSSSPTMAEISKVYAPLLLEQQFKELYTMLHPCLVQRDGKKNASAFLQGTRGSGKTLLLNQCLQALNDELAFFLKGEEKKPPFRIVKLNGIIIPGDSVWVVVKEILRQLSTAAFQQTAQADTVASAAAAPDAEDADITDNNRPKKRSKSKAFERKEKLLRLRHTTFTNNLQLLNEILQLACVDCIPVVFVLDELDAFISTSGSSLQEDTRSAVTSDNVGKDRQLLLYHLLDRVATQGSFICFVGSTSHQGIMGMLEKRIRSRAEGTSRFIQFGPCPTFASLTLLLTSKFGVSNEKDTVSGDDTDTAGSSLLQQQVTDMLTAPLDDDDDNADTCKNRVYKALQRDYRLGKGLRWFSRVFSLAIAVYRQDCVLQLQSSESSIPPFQARYVADALLDMGSSMLDETGEDRDLMLVDGVAVDPRIQALKDLSGPQVALILAARRVLTRDGIREDTSTPLTLDRMLEEYRTYQASSNRYGSHVLRKSFQDLLEMNLLVPSQDHSGGGPLQYCHDASVLFGNVHVSGRVPLHLTVDIRRELKKALEKNLLDCSTALREWGRKTN